MNHTEQISQRRASIIIIIIAIVTVISMMFMINKDKFRIAVMKNKISDKEPMSLTLVRDVKVIDILDKSHELKSDSKISITYESVDYIIDSTETKRNVIVINDSIKIKPETMMKILDENSFRR